MMTQKYNKLELQSSEKRNPIPSTRIESWKIFRDRGRKHTVKNFILVVLSDSDTPLSCRQISDVSGIEIQSLCRPLQELVNENTITMDGRTKGVSNRMVIAYSITPNKAI